MLKKRAKRNKIYNKKKNIIIDWDEFQMRDLNIKLKGAEGAKLLKEPKLSGRRNLKGPNSGHTRTGEFKET
jgi:hypothetical protein